MWYGEADLAGVNEIAEISSDGKDGQVWSGAGRYEFEDPLSPQWAQTIHVLANASDFRGVLEDFTVVNWG